MSDAYKQVQSGGFKSTDSHKWIAEFPGPKAIHREPFSLFDFGSQVYL